MVKKASIQVGDIVRVDETPGRGRTTRETFWGVVVEIDPGGSCLDQIGLGANVRGGPPRGLIVVHRFGSCPSGHKSRKVTKVARPTKRQVELAKL